MSLHTSVLGVLPGVIGPTTSVTTVQLLSAADAAAPSSTGASEEGAKLPLASYTGFLDTVPEQGMSGGAVVDSQCGVLGVIGEGGVFVRLSPSVVQRIMAVVEKL